MVFPPYPLLCCHSVWPHGGIAIVSLFRSGTHYHPVSSCSWWWVLGQLHNSSRYLKKFSNNKHEKRINRNLPMAQETSNDISWAFFPLLHLLSPSPPIVPTFRHLPSPCCVFVPFDLVVVLPSSCHFGVALIPTLQAVAHGSGSQCCGGGHQLSSLVIPKKMC